MTTLLVTGSPYYVQWEYEVYNSWPDWDVHPWPLSSIPGGILSAKQAEALSEHFSKVDVWYQIGGHGLRRRDAAFRTAHDLGVPIVIRWMGSDIAIMKSHFDRNPQSIGMVQEFFHLCAAPWFIEELRQIGIDGEFLPITTMRRRAFLEMEVPPHPDRFTVLSYIPDGKLGLYGWPIIASLAEAFPDIDFVIAAGTGDSFGDVPANVRLLGWCDDMYDAYRACSVVVRMTEHDGYSGMVQEALLLGRHVVWTYPFPGAIQAIDGATLHRQIRNLLSLHLTGELEVNREGREYIRRHLTPEVLCDRIRRKFSQMARDSFRGGRPGR